MNISLRESFGYHATRIKDRVSQFEKKSVNLRIAITLLPFILAMLACTASSQTVTDQRSPDFDNQPSLTEGLTDVPPEIIQATTALWGYIRLSDQLPESLCSGILVDDGPSIFLITIEHCKDGVQGLELQQPDQSADERQNVLFSTCEIVGERLAVYPVEEGVSEDAVIRCQLQGASADNSFKTVDQSALGSGQSLSNGDNVTALGYPISYNHYSFDWLAFSSYEGPIADGRVKGTRCITNPFITPKSAGISGGPAIGPDGKIVGVVTGPFPPEFNLLPFF